MVLTEVRAMLIELGWSSSAGSASCGRCSVRDALRGKSPRRMLAFSACISSRSASVRSGTSVGVVGKEAVLVVKASFVKLVEPGGKEDAACDGEMAVIAFIKLGSCLTAGVSSCIRGRI